MLNVKFQGDPVTVSGEFPVQGELMPEFLLCTTGLGDLNSKDLLGKKLLINIFPSLDTPVCAKSVQVFDVKCGHESGITLLNVSADLPFALSRFAEEKKLSNVIMASSFRNAEFGHQCGVLIANGVLRGLLSRSVICVDESGKVIYSELVNEITDEPDYNKAIHAFKLKDILRA
ncbi:thiol peroxidase [Vibrio vulnificus]|uniref:thiol peroxidase n=1 Tax=Vibrio vulnificus TaxID=672 RepID=UPI00102A1240|nr:thiol peroxidase [Vibrio vulnificus]RZP61095.1 thiol peroxidase [Vibrio vulnificus]